MAVLPRASYSLTARLQIANRPGMRFNKSVAPAVAEGVARAAHETGVARRSRRLDLSRVE